jgi:hypothetical protein
MPRISEREFKRLPLRAHQFFVGVPLHDVWAVDLPSPRVGITLDEFYASRTSDSTRPRRSCEGCRTYVFLPGASSDGTPTMPIGRDTLAPAGVREGPDALFRVVGSKTKNSSNWATGRSTRQR